MEFNLSAPDGTLEVNTQQPIKMTAIITLMGANDGLEALRRLLFELWKYFIWFIEIYNKFHILICIWRL